MRLRVSGWWRVVGAGRAPSALAVLLLIPPFTGCSEEDALEPICENGVDCDWVDVGSSVWMACALRSEGTVFCWGTNRDGELGDGTTKERFSPVQVQGLTDVVDLTVGGRQACVIRADGTAWCWGLNHGLLGDGTTAHRTSPVQVLLSGEVVAIGMHWSSTHALLSDGTVWRWGSELGPTPQLYPDIDNVQSLSNRGQCAVKNDGTAWCWGDNDHGRLGWGSWANSDVPVQVMGLTDVLQVSDGDEYACAVTAAEEIWCWGDNGVRQLGDGTTEDASAPVKADVAVGAVSVSAGDSHTCGTWRDGSAYCWGSDSFGAIGTNSSYSEQPIHISGLSDVMVIRPISYELATLAITADGALWGWGRLRPMLPLQVTSLDIIGASGGDDQYVADPYLVIDPYPPDVAPIVCFSEPDH
ncbi:RCC1 domain-containing protein [Myxococcota bacterium]